jgi:predicted MFS family arabinose efflux permease
LQRSAISLPLFYTENVETLTSESQTDAALIAHRWLLPFLGLACGIGVSNIYYNQPLLLEISRSFHASSSRAGLVAVATQIGYAVGMLAFVPLGDVFPRRSVMVRMFSAVSLILAASACAPSLWMLLVLSVLLGMFASVTHIVVPIAPDLADHDSRGSAIGIVMTGLLLGILLARTFAGGIASGLGWRWVFGIAAILNATFALLLWRLLPPLKPVKAVSYRSAMRSLWTLFRTHSLLREASIQSGVVFASFSGFWTTLAFLLGTPHYHKGAGVAGSFGLIGAAGATIAPLAGWLSDRSGSRSVISFALALMASAWVVLWTGRTHMLGLILGCILLDMAVQLNQIANQTRVFGVDATARSRLNTIYMTFYFFGGSIGSYASAAVWSRWQWQGVTLLGLAFLAVSVTVHHLAHSNQNVL